MREIRVALIGDFSASVLAHQAIPQALDLVAKQRAWTIKWEWIHTANLDGLQSIPLNSFQAFWCVPGSPYASEQGAIRAIQYARESGLPFLGTCGGCQHAILEYARNVLGLTSAGHAETDPTTELPLISALSCGLVEVRDSIDLDRKSRLYGIYGRDKIEE
jgi:CTP synthase (UTP-ammonia lyase)